MTRLADRNCVPLASGTAPLSTAQINSLLTELDNWAVVDGHHLVKRYIRPDFATALALTNRFGAVAEEQNHHPDLYVTWGCVEAKIWTHSIDGLSENDFILAAQFDAVAAS